MAAAFVLAGSVFVRERPELWIQLTGGALVLLWVSSVFD
jgi:hypothetical protein